MNTKSARYRRREAARIEKLRFYGLLDTEREERFDRLTRLAQRLMNTAAAAIVLVDEDRLWFKSEIGIGCREVGRDGSLCSYAVTSQKTLNVENALLDDRFKDSPVVLGHPHIRGYLGAPLKTDDGHAIGVLCIIEQNARQFSDQEVSQLEELASIVMDEIELSYTQLRLTEELFDKNEILNDLNSVLGNIKHGVYLIDEDSRVRLVNSAFTEMWEVSDDFIETEPTLEEMIEYLLDAGIIFVPEQKRRGFVERQVEKILSADETTEQWRLTNGRVFEYRCQPLSDGRRILTYYDMTHTAVRELELIETRKELNRLAYVDGLTGLRNRAACQKDLAEEFGFASPSNPFAIIQIDLDKFKKINDTLGHAAGDHLLQVLGERLRFFSDSHDGFTVYRWGGDEFIALVKRDKTTDLTTMCSELTNLIAMPLKFEQTKMRPTVSLGVARFPEDATDLNDLMIFADLALYKTKEKGGAGFHFFNFAMKDKLDSEIRIENDLRRALEEGEFQLLYQPQVSINTAKVTGVEALLYWDHPERGLIPSQDFLPVAEQTDLSPAIGREVFELALKTAKQWDDLGLQFGRMAFNIFPQHIRRGTVGRDLSDALLRIGVYANLIRVAVTESDLLMEAQSETVKMFHELRKSDVEVELDDFGVGYASLSHLSSMPISGVKLDRSFISRIHVEPKQRDIVSSLVAMASLIKLDMICEGVETELQIDQLMGLGRFSVQGHFVAAPMDFEDATLWIENGYNLNVIGLKEAGENDLDVVTAH